ncbi:MAG: histidine phosphatase family protein [Pseudomonadota bacterium]|nr:histidine phosphatase family protein [Pseudomonadota bacterium]MDE3037244.1 histidine phosphatase family protein [Pseudomonadota bacterium]
MQKILYILRHAKAEPGLAAQDDHARALIGRGMEAAEAMGKYMAQRDIRPDKILCSTAVRARETLKISLSLREPVDASRHRLPKGEEIIEYTSRLYLAPASETLSFIAQTPESVHSLLIVGHNPGFHQLALALAKTGDAALLDRLHLKFPTCALAAVTFDGAWHGIAKARGELAAFITPD